ncbi:MAG: VWA domain-containing protein [Phycisphaerales bacterium]|nr:VWA domain-containing protein [Phycisphaerales bacterium]
MSLNDPGTRSRLGGLIHSYQRYDPKNFPSPTAPPPDIAGAAMEHMMAFGSLRDLTPEELARAVKIDPSQIAGLGPSLDAIAAMLKARREKILSTYETEAALQKATDAYRDRAKGLSPPPALREKFDKAVRSEQVRDFERLWYQVGDETSRFAKDLLNLTERLGDKYQVEELASKYPFSGRTAMSVPEAIEIKEELEAIDRLLKQIEEAMKNAQIGIIDLEELSEFADPQQIAGLNELQRQVQEYIQALAAQQGLEQTRAGYQLTPAALRLFQGKLLNEVFDSLKASRTGRHTGPIEGDGPVELSKTKPYEFGDSITGMDVAQSFVNAWVRAGTEAQRHKGTQESCSSGIRAFVPPSLRPSDIEIHRTRNTPRCATCVLLDMSGSMRHGGQYVNAKRMALALDGLIRREYPGDFVGFIEMYTFARRRSVAEIPGLLPRPVSLRQPVVRLRADMSRPEMNELQIPQHFTNIQHALRLARQMLTVQDTPNRQVMLITDGLPTAHFEDEQLYMLYPPDPRTEEATMREALLAAREGITINVFLLPGWWQTSEDVQFAHRMAEATRGRVFFTAGKDLDRYVLWDYVNQRRKIIA